MSTGLRVCGSVCMLLRESDKGFEVIREEAIVVMESKLDWQKTKLSRGAAAEREGQIGRICEMVVSLSFKEAFKQVSGKGECGWTVGYLNSWSGSCAGSGDNTKDIDLCKCLAKGDPKEGHCGQRGQCFVRNVSPFRSWKYIHGEPRVHSATDHWDNLNNSSFTYAITSALLSSTCDWRPRAATIQNGLSSVRTFILALTRTGGSRAAFGRTGHIFTCDFVVYFCLWLLGRGLTRNIPNILWTKVS